MLVKDVMTPRAESVGPGLSLQETARKMRDMNIGSLPVWENGELLGIVTDRDICCRGVADGRDPETTAVREIMSRDVVCCFTHDDAGQAARLMGEKHIRRLTVLNRDRTMAGFLSVDDLAHRYYDLAGHVLEAAGGARREPSAGS